eukprot:scaffold8025_cov649-Pinguiococcus_pyrenoidosus.AAC.1
MGRLDIHHAVTTLARYASEPNHGHMDRALRLFGYLKKFPMKGIVMDPTPPTFENFEDEYKPDPDDLLLYGEVEEEIDEGLPTPSTLGDAELQITAVVDANHAHDRVTRRSITSYVIFIGSSPIMWTCKRQSVVSTSTYESEFRALRHATE